MANTYSDASKKLISKIQINGETRYVKDAAVRALLDTYGDVVTHNIASAISDGDGKIATAATVKEYVDSQVGAINKFDVQKYATLPTASASTMYILALVEDATAKSGACAEYITIRTNTAEEGQDPVYTYAWEKIGTTEADLTDYVKKTTTIAGVDLQDNITKDEMNTALDIKSLGHKDSASGTVSTVDEIAMNEMTVAGNAAVTTTETDIASTGTFTAAGTVAGTVVPTGTVAVNLSQTGTAATLTKGDYTPAGDVSVTLSGATFNKITSVGTLPTYTPAEYTAPSVNESKSLFATEGVTADIDETDDELLVIAAASTTNALTGTGFNAGSLTKATYSAGTLPTMEENTVGVATSTFTGEKSEGLAVTGVTYDKASVQSTSFTGNAEGDAITATFTGTANQAISVSGKYEKADATAAYSVAVTPTVKTITKTDKTVTVA